VLIRGTEGMAVQLANCCHPIPGDAIVGHIRKGQGLAVHQADCMHAQRARRADPERWIELQWASDSTANFTVGMDVGVLNERGVLGRIAVAIAEGDSNILNVHVEDEDARVALIHFKIQVRDRTHLARVIRTLRRVKHVVQIHRPRGGARGHQDTPGPEAGQDAS
jgi:GTP pyrophosphokinase